MSKSDKKQKRIIETNNSKLIKENVYVGPSYSNENIVNFLDSNNNGKWTRVITITPSDSVGSGNSFSFSIMF